MRGIVLSKNMRIRVIEANVTYAKRSVETKPKGHLGRPQLLISLANQLIHLHRQTGNMDHLEAAIA
ncbi:hypothetical protein BGX38DRAFT_1227232 [Terfezia claveryi]|nr:hypothetical protein BGX38DRAFT_1227232 [Terfezia claveryi]